MLSLGIIARLVRENTPGRVRIVRISARFNDVLVPGRDIVLACWPEAQPTTQLPVDGEQVLQLDMRHAGAPHAAVGGHVVVAGDRRC
jgi:hypothetical protein